MMTVVMFLRPGVLSIRYTTGSAKPGRGGRRKRKADRAKIRARIGPGVECKGWPLSWAMRRLIAWPTFRVRPLTIAQIAALATNPIILPPGVEIQFLEPKRHPGRRERRRRAKLRRRRARREARSSARAFLLAMPAFYRPPCPWALWREISRVAQRKIEQARAEERRAARRTAEMTRALLKAGVRPMPADIQTVRYPMTSGLAARIFAKVQRCAMEEAANLLIGSSAKTRTPGA